MALLLVVSFLAPALAQTPTETAPIIINQGPTARCYGWYAELTSNGIPPTTETSCAGSNMYGRFTLADYDWKYPSQYGTSPGFSGSVNGSNGSSLTVSLTNNAKNADFNDALEVNLSFDYPGSALYSNISTLDLTQYDTVIIEYDIYIQSVTSSKSDCACYSGDGPCPSWWKSQSTTDILFYQGTNPQDFNAISVRHFDPQNFGVNTWNAAGGHRVQYTDHQVPSQPGARAHVKLDAKYLFRQYSNQLCQGGGLRGPIYMRSIQLVMLNTGTDMTVQLSNVQANAFKYAPGQFTPSAVTPGPTGTNCPAATSSSTSTSTSSAPGPTTTKYGQCGGINYTGPTQCPPGTTCQYQNDYYSQCL